MDGSIIIKTELDTKSFDAQIRKLESDLESLEENYKVALKDPDFGEEKLEKFREEIEKTTNKLIELKKKQEQLNDKNVFGGISKSMGNIVQQITRWGLAVFGVRSAYMFIRQSISTLSQYNKQLATDIENIRYSLASALEPIIEQIIQLVYKLLGLLATIIKTFTGKNIFANANKGLKGAVGSAKQLKKILTSFDEMNVLQDTSASGGGGGSYAPSVDLSKIIDDEKAQKMKKWWDDILAFWNSDLVKTFKKIDGDFENFWGAIGLGFQGFWDVITNTIEVIKNVFNIIIGVLTGDKEKIEKGFIDLKDNVFNIISGLMKMIMTPINATVGLIKDIWINVLGFLKDKIVTPISNFFNDLWKKIVDGVSNAVSKIKDFFSSIPTYFSQIVDKIKNLFINIGTSVGNLIGNAFKNVINAVLSKVENVINTPIKAINKLIGKINDMPGISMSKLSTISLPRLAKGGIVNMPGRGVPIGGAIAGERGKEGVIPLTDSQQMALLGEAIGKYITINANITNTMNGRVISRELQKIQNESNFANNL